MNTEDQVATLFADANPVADAAMLDVDGRSSLEAIEQRSMIMADTLTVAPEREAVPTKRPYRLMGAAAAAVLIVGIGLVVLVSGDSKDAAAKNLEAVQQLEVALETGDFETLIGLYDPEATYRWVAPEDSVDDATASLSTTSIVMPIIFTYADWDGGGITPAAAWSDPPR